MNLNVRKGDNVKVLTGKDKGKTGKVLATDPKTSMVLVEGVNIATHHVKPRSATEQGGKRQIEAPIHVSNVQLICAACGHAVRARHQEIEGKNTRICSKCGASLDAALKADKKKKADKADKSAKKSAKKADKSEKADGAAEPAKKPAKKSAAKKAEVPVDEQPDGKTIKE